MKGLIQKSGYIRPGNGGGHYAEYIATRDGVEELKPGGYLAYMAERPRSHGLFSADGLADLEKTMDEINGHTGPAWTFIYSLKREDAVRLGYDSAESWRKLLLAHQAELAQAMKIPPKDFRWRAAFHDEKHHPHIHMMVWSADPKQGFLTEKGIEKMRSHGFASTVSGAGPCVLVLHHGDAHEELERIAAEELASGHWRVLHLAVDTKGVQVERA